MATRQTQTIARSMRLPSIIVLLVWMIVPLAMTVYFSFRYYNLLNPAAGGWAGWENPSSCPIGVLAMPGISTSREE